MTKKSTILLLFFSFFRLQLFAQYVEKDFNVKNDIQLSNSFPSKNNIYIFILKDSAENSNCFILKTIKQKINNLNFDTSNFCVQVVKLSSQAVVDTSKKEKFSINFDGAKNNINTGFHCLPPKSIIINNIELSNQIIYIPYYILIATNHNFSEIAKNRLVVSRTNYFVQQKDKENNLTSINYISSDTSLFQLISTPSYSIVTNNPIKANNASATTVNNTSKTKSSNQYGFAIGLGSFLQQYKSANSLVATSNQSFEKSPLFVNINAFYKTHLSEKVYLKFGIDLLYYSSSIYNKNLYSLPVSNTFITNPNYTINPTNPLAKSNYLVVGLSASAGYKVKLANKLLLNLEGGFCVGKAIHGWSAANFNITQGASTTTVKNNSSFSDKISIYFIANPNIEYAINKNCNLYFGLFSARGFSKMSSNSNYQFINDNGRYNALENATDKMSSQSLSFTTGISFNLK